ncbi:SDR family NAD(P)-dependent oxidoreductase [Yinghuangia seranimata]|uniref:SDR family NAD(P)-dependent oxidoreductase n=1 Tax=Yinghuangia seranimata TaxID=408067 RepID=UPI00248B7B86|nr:SDR family oxidoreductase [Yinghuangia seranimata]MDI2130108.1 SDR family oxidoreductase [Yinghuangia seranimata]
MSLKGKVVIVTGGGSGVGAAVAEAATAAGARVVISGRRADALQAVADRTGALPCPGDVSRAEDVGTLIATALEYGGRIDGVVSNAGIMRPGSVLDVTPDDWDATLATNLSALYRLAREALPHLLAVKGAIVSVSSIAGLRAPAGSAAYAASKAGMIMLTQSLAVDFGRRGVRANVVCPGWVRTEMADEEMREFGGPDGLTVDESYEAVTRLSPLGRPGTAPEIAAAVVWLLSDGSSYVNGAVLTIDGGTTVVDPGTVPFDFHLRRKDHS